MNDKTVFMAPSTGFFRVSSFVKNVNAGDTITMHKYEHKYTEEKIVKPKWYEVWKKTYVYKTIYLQYSEIVPTQVERL
jgi:hypothetical protein